MRGVQINTGLKSEMREIKLITELKNEMRVKLITGLKSDIREGKFSV